MFSICPSHAFHVCVLELHCQEPSDEHGAARTPPPACRLTHAWQRRRVTDLPFPGDVVDLMDEAKNRQASSHSRQHRPGYLPLRSTNIEPVLYVVARRADSPEHSKTETVQA